MLTASGNDFSKTHEVTAFVVLWGFRSQDASGSIWGGEHGEVTVGKIIVQVLGLGRAMGW